jgi:acyl-coenzyme A thioesterase PaaI-like protein
MQPNTHLGIDPSLCGHPDTLGPGTATVRLQTTAAMAADARGLVHGGFVFGAADYAAMLAVNDPNVVLGSADTRFLAPVQVGQVVHIAAQITTTKGRKRVVQVTATVAETQVLTGSLTCFVLDDHVLGPA